MNKTQIYEWNYVIVLFINKTNINENVNIFSLLE